MNSLSFPTWADAVFLIPMALLCVIGVLPITLKVLSKNREPSNGLSLMLGMGAILSAVAATISQSHLDPQTVFAGVLTFDRLANYANLCVLAIAGMTLFLSYNNVATRGQSFAEHVFLILTATTGMLILNSSADLVVAFVGLEIMSIALYVLIALGHEQKFSKEAAFKYFILGSFASALFLYGIALIFGTTGATAIKPLATQALVLASSNRLFLVGLVLLIAGLGFKVSMFPFHAWTPDVYQGAPTPVTAFMATGVKVVMFTVFIRLAIEGVFQADSNVIFVLQVMAILTMTAGNLAALVQENIKRMVAYSSVAHAGYILIGIIAAAASKSAEGAGAALFYLASYSLMNMGVFAVVSVVEKEERGHLSVSDYAGLGFKYPLLGICLTVFMLSLAGIPPTAGFLGKFYLFAAAFKEGFLWLALFGVFNSVLAIYYYLRVLVFLYMKEPAEKIIPQKAPLSYAVIAITAILSIVFGIGSSALYNPAVKSILDILASN